MGLFIVHLLEKVRGSHYRSRFVQNLSYSKPYRKYSLDGTDPENSWLSKNTENVKKYYRDPWCTYRFTVNGYDGLMRAVKFTCRQENADRILNVPSDPFRLRGGGPGRRPRRGRKEGEGDV